MSDAFGDRFFAVARTLGHTNNSALAEKVGVKPNEIQRLFEKLFRPKAPKVRQIAQRLEIPIETLVFGVRTAETPRPRALPDRVRRLLSPNANGCALQEDADSFTVPTTSITDEFGSQESEAELLEAIGPRGRRIVRLLEALAGEAPDRYDAVCDEVIALIGRELGRDPVSPKTARHSEGR